MAVPPISPAKGELAAPARKPSGKRKRPPSPRTEGCPVTAPAGGVAVPAPKRNRNPGVRVIGARIYDSEHGKTCHQCRQKTMDFSAACGNDRKGKPCTIRFCHKCLLNRYGERAEEVAARGDWNCPKCRDICNCSFCMKKKGHNPTGILIHTAKATGYASVSEMLQSDQMGSDGKEFGKDADAVQPLFSVKQVTVEGKEEKKIYRSSHRKVAGRTSNSSKVKAKVHGGRAIRTSKPPELKPDMSDDLSCHSTKRNKGTRKNMVGKIVYKDSNRRGKVEELINERKTALAGCNWKKAPESDRKAGRTREVHKNNITGSAKSANKTQIDTRMVLSGCNGNGTFRKRGGHGAYPELLVTDFKEERQTLSSIYNSMTLAKVMLGGACLTTVAGTELPVEDVGSALQFLEFCSAFGQVLDIKKGQPESILKELGDGRGVRRGSKSLIVQFYAKLLSWMQVDGERSPSCTASGLAWPKALKKCITDCGYSLEGLPVQWLDKGAVGHALLNSSEKLRLLNFLCDELLSTEEMRSWIDKENKKFIEKEKEDRERVLAAKEEEKILKKKLKDEVAQAMLQPRNGACMTISEHADLLSKIRNETEKVRSVVLDHFDIFKKIQSSDAVRTEPMLLEGDGRIYWRLKSCDNSRIILQEIDNWDVMVPQDKWYFFDNQQEHLLQKHIRCCVRNQKHRNTKPRRLHGSEGHMEDTSQGHCSTAR